MSGKTGKGNVRNDAFLVTPDVSNRGSLRKRKRADLDSRLKMSGMTEEGNVENDKVGKEQPFFRHPRRQLSRIHPNEGLGQASVGKDENFYLLQNSFFTLFPSIRTQSVTFRLLELGYGYF